MEARVQRARAAGRRLAFKPSEDNEALLECAEYREQAVEVEGYFFPYEKPPTKPTVVEVLGPKHHHRAAEIYIDNEVLESEEVDEKDEILEQGEAEKRKRRAEVSKLE